jgi:hypothetical protein
MPLDMDKIPGPVTRPELPELPPQFGNAVNWEELKQSGLMGFDKLVRLRRAKVPGGWFVVLGAGDARTGWFYPDPDHSWPGTSLE